MPSDPVNHNGRFLPGVFLAVALLAASVFFAWETAGPEGLGCWLLGAVNCLNTRSARRQFVAATPPTPAACSRAGAHEAMSMECRECARLAESLCGVLSVDTYDDVIDTLEDAV